MLFLATLASGFWLAAALATTAVIYGAILPEDSNVRRQRAGEAERGQRDPERADRGALRGGSADTRRD